MNTMEVTKIVGGLCGSLLVFLLIQTGADAVLFGGEGGHGGEEHFAYPIEVADAGSEGGQKQEEAAPEVDFATLWENADPAKGEKLFRACSSCHKLEDGANATGPYLYGVVGRPIASAEGYSYDDALKSLGGDWEPERIFHFIHNPSEYAPGTKMGYRGMKDAQDRADLVKYLSTIGS